MPTYTYTAMDSLGKEVKGSMESDSETNALNSLKQQGFFPTAVAESGKNGKSGVLNKSAATMVQSSGSERKSFAIPGFGGGGVKVKSKNLSIFTRQLATLISAGLPLLRSLKVLQKQERSPGLKIILKKLGESVEGGNTFSETIAQHPSVFNKLYVNMVKAGELGGVLEVVLTRLADFQEKSQKIKGKVISAMVYPIVVLTIALLILAFLMLFIVPKFQLIFTELLPPGSKLPLLTQGVIGVSNVFKSLPFLAGLVVTVIGLIFGFKMFSATASGRETLDRLQLKMPVVGDLVSKTAISRFTRTLGTLVTSGVPILQALNITRETAGNIVLSNAIGKVHDSVKEGESVVQPLEASGVFPPMVISMIDVGEETGQLPEMLMKIADNYDEEVDNAVAALTSLLEPIMIVFLAVIVGTIVIALFLPLLSIIKELQAG
ncbi:MAG: type II secretion system F family protein [Verrucomicrobiota bacterium]|nr:type II secretion system F family protein [Verrucomicrobiota bacterium]